jgi:hypothetical protein
MTQNIEFKKKSIRVFKLLYHRNLAEPDGGIFFILTSLPKAAVVYPE